jgi:hypothetical protein
MPVTRDVVDRVCRVIAVDESGDVIEDASVVREGLLADRSLVHRQDHGLGLRPTEDAPSGRSVADAPPAADLGPAPEPSIGIIWARTVSKTFWARTVSDLRLSAPRSPDETLRAQMDGAPTRRYARVERPGAPSDPSHNAAA